MTCPRCGTNNVAPFSNGGYFVVKCNECRKTYSTETCGACENQNPLTDSCELNMEDIDLPIPKRLQSPVCNEFNNPEH